MISERVGKRTTKKEKKGWKVGFSKHLSAVNRRSKSNSPANCANYEIAGDVRFGFNRRPPSPLTISFVSKEKEGKGEKRERERRGSVGGRGRDLSLKRVARKSVGTAHKTTPKFHPSDVSGTRPNKTFHFYISSEFPLMSRSPRASSQSVHTSCLVTGTKSTGLDPSKILIAFHAEPLERERRRQREEKSRDMISKHTNKEKKKKEEIRQRVLQRVGENQS